MLRSIENQTLDPSFCLQQQATPERGAAGDGPPRGRAASSPPPKYQWISHGRKTNKKKILQVNMPAEAGSGPLGEEVRQAGDGGGSLSLETEKKKAENISKSFSFYLKKKTEY